MMMTVGLGILMSAAMGALAYVHMEGYVEKAMAKAIEKMFGVKI
jgi:hypothetical protein